MAGVETMIPVVFSRDVRGGHLSLNQFVRPTSTNSAGLFGLYPQKGTIAVGFASDLVINPYPWGIGLSLPKTSEQSCPLLRLESSQTCRGDPIVLRVEYPSPP